MLGSQQVTVKFETGGDALLDTLFRLVRYKVVGDYGGSVETAFAGR
jgi:hypothetical protein